jgi:hypothetical protein
LVFKLSLGRGGYKKSALLQFGSSLRVVELIFPEIVDETWTFQKGLHEALSFKII